MGIRLPAMVIDKETGEPSNIPPFLNAKGKRNWRLVVTLDNERRVGKAFRTYRRAKKQGQKYEGHPKVKEITIVSRAYAFGPPSKITDAQLLAQNRKGLIWCPYCRKFRQFLKDPEIGEKRCPVCRVTTNGSTIWQNNPIFWKE